MSLNAATIEILLGKGLTGVDLLDVARAIETVRDPTAAERMRRYRDRRNGETRNVTRNTPSPLNPPLKSPPDPQKITPPISPQPDLSVEATDALGIEEVFEGYQLLAKDLGLPVPRDLTPERRQLLRGRVRQYSLDDFQTVFARCRGSPFLRGDVRDSTPLKFDWLFKKGNFQKVLEGNYD